MLWNEAELRFVAHEPAQMLKQFRRRARPRGQRDAGAAEHAATPAAGALGGITESDRPAVSCRNGVVDVSVDKRHVADRLARCHCL